MPTAKRCDRRTLRLWLGLAASLWLLAGCGLCTKRLYLYRDTPQKMPPAEMALLIADPNLAQAALPDANLNLGGAQWAPEQPSYQTESYRLAIEDLDGQKVYQGLCLDTTPTYAVETRPGNRRIAVRVDLLGPEGQEKFRSSVQFDLQAGKVYFLRPDWEALHNRRLTIKMESLPEAYTPQVRARLVDRRRQTTRTASLD
jgi:hypothetical protein